MIKRCGKTAYKSENKAKEQMRWIERKGKQLRYYQCQTCFMWHLSGEVLSNRRGQIKKFTDAN